METWDAITSRRKVREFTDGAIPQIDLDRILEAGRRSASARNRQFWDFVVVTERESLEALAEVWKGAQHVEGSAAASWPVSSTSATRQAGRWRRFAGRTADPSRRSCTGVAGSDPDRPAS